MTSDSARRAQLLTHSLSTGESTLVFESTDRHFEAPNWTPDGERLIINSEGLLFAVPVDGGDWTPIDLGEVPGVNNDHVLSPDGDTVYVSANDGHLYAVPLVGGAPRRVSNEHDAPFRYFLHGISPDGTTLAYVGVEPYQGKEFGRASIFTIPAAGGPDTRVTDFPAPSDGPEFSPDGSWIYFNSEYAAQTPGHAQLFRMRPDGSDLEQLTDDERVNWFPHPSPDGQVLLYLSYPPGVQGHPADKDVILRSMSPSGGPCTDVVAFFGGQGTINVNSWAPDSDRFAYVAYS
ncbi:Tol biopolymer transport system component [Microlunatus panaciterrae]|uniref:Tol biopolymer transport system component n=1 Tax=Microlunatus panaciterrae TaxID=400768 RepID=A0ABS2RGH8_9ACTN|nr:Tol biopolymer transport system component [Microlunatus panaciterrae]